MQAYKIETAVEQDDTVILRRLPFRAGERVEVIVLPAAIRIARGKIVAREMVSKVRSYAVRLLLNHRIQDYRNHYRSHIRRARQEYTFFRGRTKTEKPHLRSGRMAR